MQPIRLYDLYLSDSTGYWSWNPLKTRFALNVKGIPFETTFLSYFDVHREIPKITKTDRKPTVPVIIHDGKVIQDSWAIVQYLDKTFPETHCLLGDNVGLHQLFLDYCEKHVMMPLFMLCVLDIHAQFPDQDIQRWFRERIEKQLGGVTLENAAQDVSGHITELVSALQPIDAVLQENEYITGPQGYADVVLASFLYTLHVFQKERLENEILQPMNNLAAWWKRMEPYTKKET